MDYYIQKLEKNIATVNMFDATCQKISNYKHNNIYTTEIHSILKVHAGQCMYKHMNYKNVDDDAFNNIISTINELCTYYNINYEILCNIFNMLGVYSTYDEIGSIDYILECILILNDEYKYELNYKLLYSDEFKLFLDFYKYEYNYCNDHNINYSDYVIDYYANELIHFK